MTAHPPPPSRRRRWARRLGWTGFALGAVLGAALAWLLLTASGRDTLLGRVLGLLPPGALAWERAEGTVRGPLVLYGMRYSQDGVELRADRLLLDPDLLPVLGRRLQLDALELDGAQLDLPAAEDAPFELPRWPDVLPRLPMPLDIRSARLDIDGFAIRRGGEPLLDIAGLQASGVHLVDEGLAVERLALDSDQGRLQLKGEYRPARNFRSALEGRFSRAAAGAAPAAELQFGARGDLDAMQVDVHGTAPGPLSAQLAWREGAATPAWTLQARSEGLSPALFGADGEPLQFELRAEGQGAAATLQGEASQAGVRLDIGPSTLALRDHRLHAEPLRLVLDAGEIVVEGDLALAEGTPFDLRARSDALAWSPQAGDDTGGVLARGEARVSGRFDEWRLDGEATLVRGGESATVALAGTGDREQLRLDTLQARTPGGALDGSGTVRWSPASGASVQARLSRLDPGYFLPDYPGAISGELQLQAERGEAGAWQGEFRLDALSGQLRGRPVAGHAQADWRDGRGEGEAVLRIGASALDVRGGFGDRYDLRASFAPLQLSDLLAGVSGRLEGRATLRGPAASPDITTDLRGGDLRWGGLEVANMELVGSLPARGEGGEYTVAASEVVVAGQVVDTLSLVARGSQAALSLQADAAGPLGALALSGDVARDGDGWRGRVETLRLAAKNAPLLALEAPAAFRYGPGVLQLDRSCLQADAPGGRLCIAGADNRVQLQGEAVPLALAQAWLPVDEGLPLFAYGVLDLDADLQRTRDGRWRGQATLASAEGGLRLDPESPRDVFVYRDLQGRFTLDDEQLQGELASALAEDGSVSATLRRGLGEDAAIEGELRLDVRELTWLELFSEDLAVPVGRLQGRIGVSGRAQAPDIAGQARLAGFAAELPRLGLKLSGGEFDLVGQPDGLARLEGRVRSGEGELRLDGSLDLRDPEAPLQVVMTGENVTLASTAELYVVASPDLTLRHAEGRLEVRGRVDVPEARVDLELLDGSVSASPDVVVLDPVDPARDRDLPLDLDFSVSLGDDVRLKGFGLDGRLGGSVAFRQRPGRAPTASGTLDATGSYRAYGQALTIRRARLGYANSPVSDPTLDVLAERRFEDVTVGVQVRGTARRPETTITSSPAMDTSEALSWLVFGRPLSTATGAESQQLDAAAMALGAGGNLVAQQIGARLGLDEAGVAESRNLGGATFTVGKYLSPRLFLSYGVSLVGTGHVVTLKYLLTRGFDISVESGRENAASLNWRREK